MGTVSLRVLQVPLPFPTSGGLLQSQRGRDSACPAAISSGGPGSGEGLPSHGRGSRSGCRLSRGWGPRTPAPARPAWAAGSRRPRSRLPSPALGRQRLPSRVPVPPRFPARGAPRAATNEASAGRSGFPGAGRRTERVGARLGLGSAPLQAPAPPRPRRRAPRPSPSRRRGHRLPARVKEERGSPQPAGRRP